MPRNHFLWPVALTLAGAQILLTTLHLVVIATLPREDTVRIAFDLIEEGNLPVWWSSLLLAAIATGCLAIVLLGRGGRAAWHWIVLAGGFAALSLEETAQIHEIVGEHVPGTNGGLPELWVVVYLPVLAFGALAIRRAAGEMRPLARRVATWGLLSYIGVLVAELLAPPARLNDHDITAGALIVIEENLELLGTGLLLLATLATLHDRYRIVPRSASSGGETPQV